MVSKETKNDYNAKSHKKQKQSKKAKIGSKKKKLPQK